MKEKSDDDEIPNYITELKTVIASQGISSNTETLPKTAISSQSKSILQTANLKIVFQLLYDRLVNSKFFKTNFYGGTMIEINVSSVSGFMMFGSHRLCCGCKLIDSLKTLENGFKQNKRRNFMKTLI